MSPRPMIGITSYVEQVTWGPWEVPVALLPVPYVRAIAAAGGRPVILPPMEDGVAETVDRVDGLVLSGGADLDPALYGAEPHAETAETRPERDAAEKRLLEVALAEDLPLLAVCRGMQLLNVARGGDLIQHLGDEGAGDMHRAVPGEFTEHEVDIKPDSRLGRIVGERGSVKSHHHQAPGRVGEGLEEVAWAHSTNTGSGSDRGSGDGAVVVEGLEDPRCSFLIGVLWHPEQSEDLPLFHELVACASERMERR